jgi:hypothetical protein
MHTAWTVYTVVSVVCALYCSGCIARAVVHDIQVIFKFNCLKLSLRAYPPRQAYFLLYYVA